MSNNDTTVGVQDLSAAKKQSINGLVDLSLGSRDTNISVTLESTHEEAIPLLRVKGSDEVNENCFKNYKSIKYKSSDSHEENSVLPLNLCSKKSIHSRSQTTHSTHSADNALNTNKCKIFAKSSPTHNNASPAIISPNTPHNSNPSPNKPNVDKTDKSLVNNQINNNLINNNSNNGNNCNTQSNNHNTSNTNGNSTKNNQINNKSINSNNNMNNKNKNKRINNKNKNNNKKNVNSIGSGSTRSASKTNGNNNNSGLESNSSGKSLPKSRQAIGIKDFNELISCHLCKGYLIDATTVIECLHSFCKTCIINHLESNTPKSRFCPRCDNQIHKTKPKLNIRSDPTLQDIVYKLVPGLYKDEMNRRKEFYSKEPESVVGLSNEEKGEISGERLIFTPEDSICLSIEYFPQLISRAPLLPYYTTMCSNGALNCISNSTDNQRRYLKCEGGMRVLHLKKWLKLKYDVKDHNDIEIMYKLDPLLDDYTMIDLAYIYSWRRNGPLCLYFKILRGPQKQEEESPFKVPPVVAKRRHSLKHRIKQNKKKKMCVNESNLITTNPVNEPLLRFPSNLAINKLFGDFYNQYFGHKPHH